MIYNGLLDIADRFSTFLFDAYGVFWEGNGFYANSREVMAELVRQGKNVVIISNTTQFSPDIMASYEKRGLLPSAHYNLFVTSGDVLRQNLSRSNLSFISCPNPRKYYVIGKPHNKAFYNTVYTQVNQIEDADFIYCGVPYLYKSDVTAYPQYQEQYLPVERDDFGEFCTWDTLTAAPFIDIVNQALKLKLPILNANPDFTAKEGHKLLSGSDAAFVVRNGTVAEMFRQGGAEVVEYGKPHRNIYDYAFKQMQTENMNFIKAETCMIGDTIRTDIKGAVNAGITPILCCNTGVTAEEILHGNTIESLCQKENIMLQQITQIKSVGGE